MAKPKKDEDEAPVGKRRISSEVLLSPSMLSITTWTVSDEADRPIALVVPGKTHFDRQQVLKPYIEGDWRRFHSGVVIDNSKTTEWIDGNIVQNLQVRLVHVRMPEMPKDAMAPWYPHPSGFWDILWGLVAVDEFIVEDSLRQLVDKPFYLVHDVHKALWEARFLARENPKLETAEEFMLHFTRWITGEPLGDAGRKTLHDLGIKRLVTPPERADVLCFLLSLACHNGLVKRAIFVFDDLEQALQPNKRAVLRQLRDLLECGRRWARLGGNPLGILIGFTGSRTDTQLLEKLNASLAAEVGTGLQWSRRSLSS